jgi:hypothetical protein
MLKKAAFMTALGFCLLCTGTSYLSAQEQTSQAKNTQPRAVQAYRLDFSFNEFEGDKKINTRHYSMNLTSSASNQIKIGSRVPVGTGGNQFQYIDVGTNIWAQLRPIANSDQEELVIHNEISSLDPNAQGASGSIADPTIRQIKIEGSTILAEGKPLIVSSMDDPTSKRQFQLEVTVTKLR